MGIFLREDKDASAPESVESSRGASVCRSHGLRRIAGFATSAISGFCSAMNWTRRRTRFEMFGWSMAVRAPVSQACADDSMAAAPVACADNVGEGCHEAEWVYSTRNTTKNG